MAPDYPSRAVLGQLWADRMQHKVIMLVVAQFEILKISQKWVNHQNENYFGPGWGEEARALLALPFSFQVNQWGASFPSATWATQQKQNILKLYLVTHMMQSDFKAMQSCGLGHNQSLKKYPKWEIDSVEAIVRKISNVMWEWAAVCDKDTSLSSFVRPCLSAPVMPASFSPTSSTSPPLLLLLLAPTRQDRTTSLRHFRHQYQFQFQFQFQFFGLDNSTRTYSSG